MKKAIICFAMVTSLAVSTMAMDWNFYGSVRTKALGTDAGGIFTGTTYVPQSDLGLQSNSVIGAKVKVNEKLSAQFEYGSAPNLRILAADYNFGLGVLTIGQTYSPLNALISNQILGDDNNMIGLGAIYTGRNPLIQIATMGLKIAAVQPNSRSDVRIQAAYAIDPTISIVGSVVNDGWLAGLVGSISQENMYVKGNAFYTKNPDKVGLSNVGASADNISDNVYGGLVVVGWKNVVMNMIGVEGGYGYYKNKSVNGAYTGWYVQTPVALDKNLSIVPEYGKFIDTLSNSSKNYFGVKCQLDF